MFHMEKYVFQSWATWKRCLHFNVPKVAILTHFVLNLPHLTVQIEFIVALYYMLLPFYAHQQYKVEKQGQEIRPIVKEYQEHQIMLSYTVACVTLFIQ